LKETRNTGKKERQPAGTGDADDADGGAGGKRATRAAKAAPSERQRSEANKGLEKPTLDDVLERVDPEENRIYFTLVEEKPDNYAVKWRF
jgi:hypothetical protein